MRGRAPNAATLQSPSRIMPKPPAAFSSVIVTCSRVGMAPLRWSGEAEGASLAAEQPDEDEKKSLKQRACCTCQAAHMPPTPSRCLAHCTQNYSIVIRWADVF